MLIIGGVIAILTAGMAICESYIVTPKEAVTATIYELAEIVQHNDVNSAVGYVSSKREATRNRVLKEMPRYDFQSCYVIGFNEFQLLSETEALINFVVLARASLRPDTLMIPVQREIQLKMKLSRDNKWQIIDYKHFDPRKDIRL